MRAIRTTARVLADHLDGLSSLGIESKSSLPYGCSTAGFDAGSSEQIRRGARQRVRQPGFLSRQYLNLGVTE